MGILLISQDPIYGKLVAKEAVAPTRWFMQSFPGPFAESYKLFDIPLIRTLYESIENLTAPGISLHNALRKCWIEKQTISIVTSECKQVIVLGAGFDTLVYRLHQRFPEVHWWEIDHPATQDVKRRALKQNGEVAENFVLTPADFSQQTLNKILEQLPDYDKASATLFIAEGLLMYLNETEVKELLTAIYENSCPGSSIIGSLLQPTADGRLVMPGTNRLADLRLELMGEPYRWGLEPDDMPAFFKEHGFKTTEVTNDKQLISEYLPEQSSKVSLPDGEYFFQATRL